jgi:hypothetical protein
MKMPNFVWFYVIAVSFPAAATTVLRCHWPPFGLEASIFNLILLAIWALISLLGLRKANYPDRGAVQRLHLMTGPLAM